MLKKVLVVAALLCVMVPFAAQDNAGKWGIEVTGWYGQALGVDTTYVYGLQQTQVNNVISTTEKPYTLRNEYRWSPSLKLSYGTDAFTFWVDYTYYDQNKTNNVSIDNPLNNEYDLNPALTNGQYYFTYCDAAQATIATTYTNWDVNIGHTFHPTDKWALMVYGGLRHINLENNVYATYMDSYDQNYWGAGATDDVRLHTLMTGWGLNFGLQNDLTFGKRWAIGTGLEVSMLSTTTDYDQYEAINFIDPGTGLPVIYGVTGITRSQQKVTPAVKMYVEAKFNFTDSWYGKVGYRYEWIKEGFGFDYGNTPYFSATGYDGGYFPTSKDSTFDGLYFTLGFKF